MRKSLIHKMLCAWKNRKKTAGGVLDKGDSASSADRLADATEMPQDHPRKQRTACAFEPRAREEHQCNSQVVLYTRTECHLCEQAEALLLEHDVDYQTIDIDLYQHKRPNESESLQQRFNTCVPVLEVHGKIRFRGRIDPILLRRIIQSELNRDRSSRRKKVGENRLGMMVKHWTPGLAKTRLAATIGDHNACLFAQTCFKTLTARLHAIGDARCVVFAPHDQHDAFRQATPDCWDLTPQSDGTLGKRMLAFFTESFDRGFHRVVLIGSDSPDLPEETVIQAFEALANRPLVFGPATDGGYYLIGAAWEARNDLPHLFDEIPWGTEAVWEATKARLEERQLMPGAQFTVLPTWHDIDLASDLAQLQARIQPESAQFAELSACLRHIMS